MIILDRAADDTIPDTGERLQFLLGGAVGTQLTYNTSFVEFDDAQQNLAPTNKNGVSNDTTPVDILEPPAQEGSTRQLKFLSIYQPNASSVTVTIRLDDNGTTRIILVQILDQFDTLQYTDGEGFKVTDADGNIKITIDPGAVESFVSAQLSPVAATLSTLYTVPASTRVKGKITVINRDPISTSFRLAKRVAGAAISDEMYLAYDVPILGNDVYESVDIVANATDILSVYATLATLSFNFNGTAYV